MPTRRRFLTQSLLAGTSWVLSGRGAALESTSDYMDPSAVGALARRLKRTLVQPDDLDYESAHGVFFRNALTDLRERWRNAIHVRRWRQAPLPDW